jgi:hypothetical protein
LLFISSLFAGLENWLCLSCHSHCIWNGVVFKVQVRIVVSSKIIKGDLFLLILLILHHSLCFLLLTRLFGWSVLLLHVGITI